MKKKCKKCGINRTLDWFHKNKTAPDGHRAVCMECRNKYGVRDIPKEDDSYVTDEELEQAEKDIRASNDRIHCSGCGEMKHPHEFAVWRWQKMVRSWNTGELLPSLYHEERYFRQPMCRACHKEGNENRRRRKVAHKNARETLFWARFGLEPPSV